MKNPLKLDQFISLLHKNRMLDSDFTDEVLLLRLHVLAISEHIEATH